MISKYFYNLLISLILLANTLLFGQFNISGSSSINYGNSQNNYDFTEKALELANNNHNSVIGFITQKYIKSNNMVCMTPGISINKNTIDDQRYNTHNNVDTDYIIVGRAIYQLSLIHI